MVNGAIAIPFAGILPSLWELIPAWVHCLMPPVVSPIPFVVVRAQAGDRQALRELYEAHVDAVHGFCLAFCRGNRETARDLTQDTFIQAFSALSSLREPTAFPSWLRTTTRRTCLRWLEQRKKESRALQELEHEPVLAADDREALLRAVSEVMDACPDPSLRETAILFYREPPHSIAEIAALLSLSQTAVTTRLLRFRTWARKRMLGRLAAALEEAP